MHIKTAYFSSNAKLEIHKHFTEVYAYNHILFFALQRNHLFTLPALYAIFPAIALIPRRWRVCFDLIKFGWLPPTHPRSQEWCLSEGDQIIPCIYWHWDSPHFVPFSPNRQLHCSHIDWFTGPLPNVQSLSLTPQAFGHHAQLNIGPYIFSSISQWDKDGAISYLHIWTKSST